MAATIRFNDDEIPAVTRGFIRTIDRDNWHRVKPFWYKHNQYNTWEAYTSEEMSTICDNSLSTDPEMVKNHRVQKFPKAYATLAKAMLINHG